jgi:hypothetical protein
MEIEDDDDAPAQSPACTSHVLCIFMPNPYHVQVADATSVPPAVDQPTQRLLCTNLPQEVTNDVLSVLFQQYASPLSSQCLLSDL